MQHYLDSSQVDNFDKYLLGGKGYALAKMQSLNLPVPKAFIVTTDYCKDFYKNKKETVLKLIDEINQLNDHFKDDLVSVRSGAPVSMPGMMDTILNLGINKDNINSFLKKYDKNFVYDCYIRFLKMYGETALNIPKKSFTHLNNKKFKNEKEINDEFGKVYAKHKQELPAGKIEDQLLMSILAVLNSWDSNRAKEYRKINNIGDDIGTAVVVQKMVFGNKNQNSASGVLFSRDSSTGHPYPTGEFLIAAQGEDVVSGTRTPEDFSLLEIKNEKAYQKLFEICRLLESKYKTVQDIEFTIDDNNVYVLQTRSAKLTPLAKLKTSIDFYKEKLIDVKEIFERISYQDYLFLNVKKVDPLFDYPALTKGLPASNGVITGKVIFNLKAAQNINGPKIFIAQDTDTEDLPIFNLVDGIVTTVGGVTSHAAVVARGLNKICIVGANQITINKTNNGSYAQIDKTTIKEGDEITIDADTGRIWHNIEVPVIDGKNNKLIFALEDLIYQAYPLIRVTSNVDEIDRQYKTVYATYLLDNEKDDFIKKELLDACEFLNGVIDLTGKLDYMQNVYNEIPFVNYLTNQIIERKINILNSYKGENKNNFSVYLGPHYQKYTEALSFNGFRVCPNDKLDFSLLKNENKEKSLFTKETIKIINKLEDSIKKQIKNQENNDEKTYAISARNAIASILK